MKTRKNKSQKTTSSVKRKLKSTGAKIKGKKITSRKKKIFLNILLIGVITFIVLISLFFAYVVAKAPKFDPNNLKFKQMSIIYDADGEVIAKLGDENRTEISYDDIPEVLLDAIIATEDSRFFQHNGFDLPRFMVAAGKKLIGQNGGGASTLTMQIVKNNYTSTTASGWDGIVRKFTDIYLAIFKVEKQYTKKEIVEFYVNDSYLGNGAYGIEQASKNYFGKSVSELNLAEASFIAGLFQSPRLYNPYNYPEKAEKRRQTVLYLMQRHGYITAEERKIASAKEIRNLVMTDQIETSYTEYQGYIDTVVEELEDEYNLSPYTTPLLIHTAMKKEKQDFVNRVMNGQAWTWENDVVQSGIVMTNSNTGEVIAVGAGRNKNTQLSFNYATMLNKQIGSTAKPIFDYGPAVEYLGWGTVNYTVDEPHTYSNGRTMNNSDMGYRGILPMYQALGLSRNITALKTFQTVSKEAGNEKIAEFATSLGITPEIEGGMVHEAHSIGSFTGSTKEGESRTSPMTMAGAYGAFSNGGYYIKPHTITKYVYRETDEVVVPEITKTRVMNDSTAYIINYSLRWSATTGLARAAAGISGVETAAKTGTSNYDNDTIRKYGLVRSVNDLWVCGYTPNEVITFWYGYSKVSSEHYNTTANWTTRDKFYRNLAENMFTKDGSTFKVPDSIVSVEVAKNSMPLKLASDNTPGDMIVTGLFRKGTAPTETTKSFDQLPNVTSITSKVSDKTVTLNWDGISAEEMLELELDETFGLLGYDIYVKDGATGVETYVGTTTSSTYTHVTNYSKPVYVIYTAYQSYKGNKSSGASHSVTIKSTDFDVKVSSTTMYVGDALHISPPIIVLYNSVDVTDQATIVETNNTVDTTTPGKYKITYKITYNGVTKTVSETVIVKERTEVTTTTTTTN